MAARDTRTRLRRRASKVNLPIPEAQVERLSEYFDLLFKWNRKINLTGLTQPDEAIDRLLLEPLLAARHLPPGAGRLIDIGSGGGSPAIPLAVTLGYLVTMVESKARKAAFLREAVRALGLQNAAVQTTRFETLVSDPVHRAAYTVFSVRAVRLDRPTLTELSAFLVTGGLGLVFRGPSGADQGIEAPPLKWAGTYPLVPESSSRLTVYRRGI